MSNINVPEFGCFFLIGLLAPQSVADMVKKLRDNYAMQGEITAPFPPLLPVFYLTSPPSAPVPGLLPFCTQGIAVNSCPTIPLGGKWGILPVDTGEWLVNLVQTFPDTRICTLPEDVFPACLGIPIAWLPKNVRNKPIRGCDNVGWRALTLVCYKIRFNRNRPWFMTVQWTELWRRRLRRAPGNL